MTDDPSPLPVRRILVALDASPHSRAALAMAVDLAADLGAEIEGVFIEDESLLRAARLPFVQEVRSYQRGPQQITDRRMERQMRQQAERAEEDLWRAAEPADVPFDFRVVRGEVAERLLEAAQSADLLALGKTSRDSSRRQLGATARAAVLQASTPVLIARQASPATRPVLAYYDGSAAAEAALRLAAQLACRMPDVPMRVLLPPASTANAETLREVVRERCAKMASLVHIRPLTRFEASHFASVLREGNGRLAVLPSSFLESQPAPMQRLLYEIDAPVLVAR